MWKSTLNVIIPSELKTDNSYTKVKMKLQIDKTDNRETQNTKSNTT